MSPSPVDSNNPHIAPLDYSDLLSQIESIAQHESNPISTLANISSVMYHAYSDSDAYNTLNNSDDSTFKRVNWFGFYLRNDERNELVLGPFHGRMACTRIRYGKGVCGTAWKELQSQVVRDVHELANHIACDSASQSEVVVPIMYRGSECLGVIDVDSLRTGAFGDEDREFLEKVAQILTEKLDWKEIASLARLVEKADEKQ